MTSNPTFLAIGNLTLDMVGADGGATTPGGSCYYSGDCANALGCQVRVVSRVGPDMDAGFLAGLPFELLTLPAPASTRMANHYSPAGRWQELHEPGGVILEADVPGPWWGAAVTLLCPVYREIDPALAGRPVGGLVGLSVQGLLRAAGPDRRIIPDPAEDLLARLPPVDVLYYSEEDIRGFPEIVRRFRSLSRVLVETRGADGAVLHMDGRETHIPGSPVRELDPTGAGDTFAAAHLVSMSQGTEPVEAARRACYIAAHQVSIEGPLKALPEPPPPSRERERGTNEQ